MGRCWGIGVVGLLLLGLLWTGCERREPLRIGFFAILSGRGADLGVSGRNGAMLAVEERNAAGGIHGRKIDLLVRDATSDPETGRQMLAELLRQRVVAVIGPMTSGVAMEAVPLVNAAQIPLVSPTATTTALTGLDDFFLRVTSDTTVYAIRSAHYQAQRLGHRRGAVIYDLANRAYTESWLRDFRQEFSTWGGELVVERRFSSGVDETFSPLVEQLLAVQPDFVLVLANAVDGAQICQQIRKADPTMPIAMSEWGSTERFVELAGSAAENVYISQFLDRNDPSPRYQRFRQAYQQRFGQEPGFAGLAAYDAASVVLAALERQSAGESLKNALLRLGDFQGGQQRFGFDRFGDADRPNYLSVIRGGQYQSVE